jgi:hypothetical protein
MSRSYYVMEGEGDGLGKVLVAKRGVVGTDWCRQMPRMAAEIGGLEWRDKAHRRGDTRGIVGRLVVVARALCGDDGARGCWEPSPD